MLRRNRKGRGIATPVLYCRSGDTRRRPEHVSVVTDSSGLIQVRWIRVNRLAPVAKITKKVIIAKGQC